MFYILDQIQRRPVLEPSESAASPEGTSNRGHPHSCAAAREEHPGDSVDHSENSGHLSVELFLGQRIQIQT